ncbi:unnamed protein product [Absidia cylindrospora]
MTNSVYTLSPIKKEPSTTNAPDYMDINSDEAEAGSILMALSQHTKRSERSTTMNTMSIRNLLDNEDEHTATNQAQSKMDGHMLTGTTRPPNAHTYPEATKEISQAYANRMHGHYSTSTTLPDAPTPMRSTSQRQSESYDWQHKQQPSYNTQHHPQDRYQQYPINHHHQHSTHQQQQPQSIKQPYNRYDPQQQRYQSMRKHPKIRRNALHAYISYMTYSDLKRMKSNSQQPHGRQLMSKQVIHSSPAPLSEEPAAPILSSSVQQQHHHPHHQPPLTAFLKDTADPAIPSTPIPKPSLPQIESRRPSNDWPSHHYHSSPPPQRPYRHPYPTSSFSAKQH